MTTTTSRLRSLAGSCLTAMTALLLCLLTAPSAAGVVTSDPVGPNGWTPDGPVHAIVASGDRVYVGGAFTGGVVALDATTGSPLWTAGTNGGVRALALSSDGSRLVVGGAFTAVGGATHRKLALLSAATGAVVPTWRAGVAGLVRDIVVRDDVAYFGGQFAKHNGLAQRGLGAVLVSTGKPVAGFDPATDDHVYALTLSGDRLFVGGRFTTVDGQPRNAIAAIDVPSGTVTPWAPARVCPACNLHWDVVTDGSTVYGAGRNAGAAVAWDATTGALRWQVPADGDGQALELADGVLYLGGHFTDIGQPLQPRTILAALDPATGALDGAFRPRFSRTYPGVWALESTASALWVGGHFSGAGAPTPLRYPYLAMFGR